MLSIECPPVNSEYERAAYLCCIFATLEQQPHLRCLQGLGLVSRRDDAQLGELLPTALPLNAIIDAQPNSLEKTKA
ncbi:MAG: hypothetical protein KFH87_06525 [Bacteroidetes bacterium]|nr:hypothetical protein [Bacteroidota bacterium]